MKIFIFLFYFFVLNIAFATDSGILSDKTRSAANTNPKKVFVGGDIGATFGDYTQITLSPLVGYRFSNEISGGLQFIYNHSWQYINKDQVNQTTLQSNTYGGNMYLQYNPMISFYLKGEFEYDSYTNYETTQGTSVMN